jgi:hypothetical protein
MRAVYRIPRWCIPIYEEGRRAARIEREQNPDRRTVVLDAVAAERKARDRTRKIERTMRIAREYTARRRAAACRAPGSRP